MIRFTRSSYDNEKKTNTNCFSHLSLAIGNSVHSKIKVFATEVIIYIYIYIHIYIYYIYVVYIYIIYYIYYIYTKMKKFSLEMLSGEIAKFSSVKIFFIDLF